MKIFKIKLWEFVLPTFHSNFGLLIPDGFECVILENHFPPLAQSVNPGRRAAQMMRPPVQKCPQDKRAEEFMVRKGRVREGLCLGKGTKML